MLKPKQPKPVEMPDPVRIPSPDDPDLMAARRRKMQEETGKRQGRSSTELTPDQAFMRSTLG